MSAWGKCDLAEDQLKAFTRSTVRMKTLLCLIEGDMDSGDLEKKIGTRASTILHTIKDLTEKELVIKSKRGYALTNVGRIQAMLLDDLVEAIVALDQHKEFWLTHDLTGIPSDLQKKIGMLAQSEIMASSSEAIFRTVEYFVQEMAKAKEIRGVSPIIVPGYADMIAGNVKRGAKVDLILTDNILNIVCEQHGELLKDLIEQDNFRLYRTDLDVKVAFTVTESMLDLGLFRLDGSYDLGADLVCIGEGSINWGRELFEHYRGLSQIVDDPEFISNIAIRMRG